MTLLAGERGGGVGLRFAVVDAGSAEEWRYVHNLIVPTAPLGAGDMPGRLDRNHLELAYDGDVLVGCSTVRPPGGAEMTATVIVRVLPEHRRRGFGAAFYRHEVAHARGMGAGAIETVVLQSNEDGLRFALARGFTEIERYLLPGDTVPFIDLRLTEPAAG